ncbi:uncharacterized protein A4U43_C01F26450, partial [Asparagus officinalis]
MLPLSFQYRPRVAMPSISLSLLFLLTRFAATATSSESTSAACKVLRATPSSAAPSSPLEITVPPYDYGRYSVKQALKQRQAQRPRSSAATSPKAATPTRVQRSQLSLPPRRGAGPARLDRGEGADERGGDEPADLLRMGWKLLEASRSCMECSRMEQRCTGFSGAGDVSGRPERWGTVGPAAQFQLKVLVLVLLERGKDFLLSVVSGVEIIKADFQGPAKFGRNLLEGNASVVPLSQPVIVVARDGTGNFTTINDAVAFVPNGTSSDDGYIAIFIRPGVYEENVIVAKSKRNLIMIGAGIDQTVITGNRSVFDGWTTYNSATFAVHGERFIAINITFENTAGPEKHQAVALRNSADLSSFYRCKFVGYQDTLYAHSLRQFYRDCEIKGT